MQMNANISQSRLENKRANFGVLQLPLFNQLRLEEMRPTAFRHSRYEGIEYKKNQKICTLWVKEDVIRKLDRLYWDKGNKK